MIKKPSSVWRPYTQMKTASPAPIVKKAKGIFLELENGQKVMDCISSWWVTLHGHAQEEIALAIAKQASTLEQVISADFTHSLAEELADRLIQKLPLSLTRVFYSDNGSTAVEVALKMALQFWKNQKNVSKTKFLSFNHAYHGDTVGAMSVGEKSIFTDPFSEMLFEVDRIPYPETWYGNSSIETKENDILKNLEVFLQNNAYQYAGMILEPLIQGAGGMKMCRPEFLQQLAILLHKHDILIIYDEVMVGFGRTGSWFACKKSNTNPDIICLSKGITGGFLPFAATICNEHIYQAFYDEDITKTFYHGHSYTANPISCSAALASMNLLEKTENRFEQIESWYHEWLPTLLNHSKLEKVRICGTILAMDVITDESTHYSNQIGPYLKQEFLKKGFFLRPLGNVVYILPPYCIQKEQVNSIIHCILEVLDHKL